MAWRGPDATVASGDLSLRVDCSLLMKSIHGEAAVTTSTWKKILAGAVFLSAAAGSLLHAQRPAPDLILSNGKIITVDEKFTIAQAVAVRGVRVVAVGSNQAI